MSAVDVVARMIFDDEHTKATTPFERPTQQQLDKYWRSLPDTGLAHYRDRAQRYIDAADADRGMA